MAQSRLDDPTARGCGTADGQLRQAGAAGNGVTCIPGKTA
jgi:hypothetical protein